MANVKILNEKFKYEIYNIFHLFYDEIHFVNDDKYDYNVIVGDYSIKILHNDLCEDFKFEDKLTSKENVKKILYKFLSKDVNIELPWGTLVGIRPTKIALKLMKDGKTKEEVKEYFAKHSLTREDKINLCIDVAEKEENFVNKNNNSVSVYIGMPFCPTRCLYCSFISDTIQNCKGIVDDYLQAMYYEMENIYKYIKSKNLNIECVYFGGGTPTSINNKQFEETMFRIYNSFIKGNNVREFTVECGRPDSITREKLNTLKKYGVHRISINPQTMNDATLKLIGRGHNSKDIIDKFNLARSLGFDNINVDIIVGLPGEGLEEVKYTCSEILQLSPDSLTVHGMSLKRGSKLHQNILNNIHMKIATQDELNEMYDETVKLSKDLKLKPYYMYRQKNMVGNMENIGYSKFGRECIYNIEMIEERQTIIAIGANAVSKTIFLEENRLERFPNVKDVREYIKRIEEKVESKIKFLNELY
ncbi:coproporphyrinogen III oxidase [Clostridium arbusti]|uniref:coproporphyrinogen III oxidase n=1 Tax=Clostridium arbusti TaxID=1137848 RepID=UPI000288E79B|nr:coproporphyrinogen III oxidase [Clostridium arbusti]